MNRTIKFRSWNIEENIMHDLAFPSWNGSHEVWEDNKPQSKVQYLSNNGPEEQGILMQYTGLKDKNGVEIYEGDIVEGSYFEPNPLTEIKYTGSIVFEDASFICKSEGLIDRYIGDRLFKGLEVIGNVHQNKELLQ